MSGDFFLPLQNWWSCYISINWRRKLLYFLDIVWIILKLCTESVVVNHSPSMLLLICLCVCVFFFLVFLKLFKCISTPIPTHHMVWTVGFNMTRTYRFSILWQPVSHDPPALHLSINDWLTDQHRPLISKWDFDSAPGSIWTAHAQSLLKQYAHTYTLSTCVWERFCGSWKFFFCLFWVFFLIIIIVISFVLALLCTAWTIRVIVTKSSRKDFMELTIIPLSLVFQMQKECFSLPANKATITLFLYTNGKKKKVYL